VLQPTLLRTVAEKLDFAGIDYMITGSIVSSLQGEPRLTHDLDVVVQIEAADVPSILRAFPPSQYYLSEPAVLEAIQTKGMFNVIDVEEGDKIDFWVLTSEPFDRSRFSRKYVEEVFGIPLKVSSPEDTILAKLRWSKECGGSEKHFVDALRVYEVQAGVLDMEYLGKWATKLGASDLLDRVVSEAVP